MTDDLPIEHIRRPDLPWREAILTECGKPIDQVPTLSRDEALAKIRKLGRQRAAFTTCMTCWSTASTWPTWEKDPVRAMAREFHNGRTGDPRLRDELLALAALVREHRDEFDDFMAGIGDAVRLDERRRLRRVGGAR